MAQQFLPGFAPSLGARLGGLLGNAGVQQFFIWQVLAQLVGAGLAPVLTAEQQTAWKAAIKAGLETEINPADLVDAYIKGHIDYQPALDAAAAWGVGKDHFDTLAAAAGEPPGLDFLAEAQRRGFIAKTGTGPDATSLEQGIRESRLKDKWFGVVEKMQFRLPDPGVILEAWVRAQIAEPQARALLLMHGIDDATATLWYKSIGRPPSPGELLELTRRGIIPEAGTGGDTLSLEQGYLETDLKNKWYERWKALLVYVPPPRTVTAMLKEGAYTEAQAIKRYQDAGLSPEDVAAYVEAAHHQRVAATKELNKSEILTLYTDRLISKDQAAAMLAKEGYAPDTAAYELESADFRTTRASLSTVLGRLRSLYIAHKLDKQTALDALGGLGLDPTMAATQLGIWDEARVNNVAILTAAQIGELVKLGWYTFAAGAGLLEGHGYSADDAQLYLLEHLKLQPNAQLPAGVTVSPS